MILIGAVLGYVFFVYSGKPEQGDCLTTLEESFTGWDIVDCGDPKAAWEVVATDTSGGYDLDLGTCDGHPDGQQVNERNGKRGRRWEMCVVPTGTAK